MRLKGGNEVEVMIKKEKPVSCRGMAGEKMETVSRKSVRPYPPILQGGENFIVGDVVEVFDENSWKIAVILKVLEGKKGTKSKRVSQDTTVQKQYLVRQIGCSHSRESIVLGSNIRMRQTGREGKRIQIGKGSQGGGDIIASKPSSSNFYQAIRFQTPESNTMTKKQPKEDSVRIQDQAVPQESRIISSVSLKRKSPYVSSIVEANKRSLKWKSPNVRKSSAIEKDGSKKRVSPTMLQKVDAVAYPREVLGSMHASFKVSSEYNQIERTKLSDVLGCCWVRNSENGLDSDACSVGSCSVTDQNSNNFYNPSTAQPWPQEDTLNSDAESCNGTGSERKNCGIPPQEEVDVSIHILELHAYRRTLEALYASGPLSWDQEALLTNLRIVLNISNDEHLMELKHLICAESP